jgi:hypothetical protein
VDVVVAKLGYQYSAQVWEVLEERMPAYQPKSKTRDWDEEVRFLTAGAAVMILEALGPLAFHDREIEVSQLCAALKQLSSSLNEASHHQEGKRHSVGTFSRIADFILKLLTIAEAVFGEQLGKIHPSRLVLGLQLGRRSSAGLCFEIGSEKVSVFTAIRLQAIASL